MIVNSTGVVDEKWLRQPETAIADPMPSEVRYVRRETIYPFALVKDIVGESENSSDDFFQGFSSGFA